MRATPAWLDGDWCGEIASALGGGLATASGHIVLQALAMPAVWTGGRPEDCGSSCALNRITMSPPELETHCLLRVDFGSISSGATYGEARSTVQ